VSILGHFSRRIAKSLGAGALVLAPTVLGATSARGEGDAAVDPRDRSGDFVVYEPRPVVPREVRACSFRHELCVHAPVAYSDDALAWLDALDRGWDGTTGALALPSPDPSVETGVLDVYVVSSVPYFARAELDRRDVASTFDRANAFGVVGTAPRRGCALDRAAALLIARAISFRVAPSTDVGSSLAEAAAVANILSPCAAAAERANELAYFQLHPEVGLANDLGPPSEIIPPRALDPSGDTPGERYAKGSALFYDWLDDAFGGSAGAIVPAVWALHATRTPTGAARWNNEPDTFDVLRTTFEGALTTGSTIDDLWLDFAVARAFIPGFPVRVEWSIDWPVEPRALLSGLGLSPTGSAYVSIDCERRPPKSRLRFEAHWEEHARILWTLVRVDAGGRELSRIGVPAPIRGTDAQTTLVDLDGVARVLIVGSNAGDHLGLAPPLDPDDYRREPHGWLVSVVGE
jgi:hypothetical protein